MQRENRIVVIGGGAAGRESARSAVRLGADVTLITERPPARARLDYAAVRLLAMNAERAAQAWGPEGPTAGARYAPAMIETLAGALGIGARNFNNEIAGLQDIGVRVVEGKGRVSAPNVVSVTWPGGETDYPNCRAIILATGARSFLDAKSRRILTPATMPSLTEVPESLIVLGSSAAALEMAHFFASYGVAVTVVGGRRAALYFLDRDLREKVAARAADNGIRILAEVTAVTGTANDRVDLLLTDGSHVDAEYALLCGEGAPRTEELGLEGPGVRIGPDGEIVVDERMETNVPGIFAVGSATGHCAHNVAMKQAEVAAENALGGESYINYNLIPAAAWFDPQIGAVGLTEEAAKENGISATSFAACLAPGPLPERCAKLVADEPTGRILGLHAIGTGAPEIAHLGALAIHAGIIPGDIADLSYIRGTMAECVSNAAALGPRPFPQIVHPLVTGPE